MRDGSVKLNLIIWACTLPLLLGCLCILQARSMVPMSLLSCFPGFALGSFAVTYAAGLGAYERAVAFLNEERLTLIERMCLVWMVLLVIISAFCLWAFIDETSPAAAFFGSSSYSVTHSSGSWGGVLETVALPLAVVSGIMWTHVGCRALQAGEHELCEEKTAGTSSCPFMGAVELAILCCMAFRAWAWFGLLPYTTMTGDLVVPPIGIIVGVVLILALVACIVLIGRQTDSSYAVRLICLAALGEFLGSNAAQAINQSLVGFATLYPSLLVLHLVSVAVFVGLTVSLVRKPEAPAVPIELTPCDEVLQEAQTLFEAAQLSSREREVMLFTLRGLASAQVADELGVKATTVREMQRRARKKLGPDGIDSLFELERMYREGMEKETIPAERVKDGSTHDAAGGALITLAVSCGLIVIATIPIGLSTTLGFTTEDGFCGACLVGLILGWCVVRFRDVNAPRKPAALLRRASFVVCCTAFVACVIERLFQKGAFTSTADGPAFIGMGTFPAALSIIICVLVCAGTVSVLLSLVELDVSIRDIGLASVPAFSIGYLLSACWWTKNLESIEVGAVVLAIALLVAAVWYLVRSFDAGYLALGSVVAFLLLGWLFDADMLCIFVVLCMFLSVTVLLSLRNKNADATGPFDTPLLFDVALAPAFGVWLGMQLFDFRSEVLDGSAFELVSSADIFSALVLLSVGCSLAVLCVVCLIRVEVRQRYLRLLSERVADGGDSLHAVLEAYGLSERQADVLLALVNGSKVSVVAREMSLSESAIYKERKNALALLGVRTLSDAVALLERELV